MNILKEFLKVLLKPTLERVKNREMNERLEINEQRMAKYEENNERNERIVTRLAYNTIDERLLNCVKRTEIRNGVKFDYWTNTFGTDIKMLDSEGCGFIKLTNQYGQAFAMVGFNSNGNTALILDDNYLCFRLNMQWFLSNHVEKKIYKDIK